MKFYSFLPGLHATCASLALCMAGALLAGCGAGTASGSDPTASVAGFPVSVDNCGTEVRFDSAPSRVVTIKSAATETLLALGLGDRIVGEAFADGPVPAQWSDEAARIPRLSDQVPAQEVVLEQDPDLVLAGWESNFAADGAGERASLEALGVRTYVLPAACRAPRYRPERLGFDDVFAQIQQVGAILGATQDADRLVDAQRRSLAAISPAAPGTSALWYSSGSTIPYVGAGIGAPQMVLETLGLSNIAGDVRDSWTPMSWEKIVEADPEVIVLVDAAWNTAESKIDRLRSNPATAALDAVRHDRYLTIPFPASEAGVRTVPATVDLAAQLAALGLAGSPE